MADRGQPISDVFDVPVIKSQYETVIGYVDSLAERMQKFNADNEKLGGANTFAGINTSIKETTKALPELAAAQEKVYQSEAKLTILLAQKQKTYTELGLATNEYKKQSDALATTEAKLSVATSDEAKALAAKSVELKEARKALIDEAKANNDSVKARIASKQAALDEAKAAKQAAADKKKADADIVAATRDKLKAQQDEARQAKINQKIEADLKDERKQLTLVLKQQEQEYYAVARAKGRDSDEAKTALASSTATRKIINELDQDLGNYQKTLAIILALCNKDLVISEPLHK